MRRVAAPAAMLAVVAIAGLYHVRLRTLQTRSLRRPAAETVLVVETCLPVEARAGGQSRIVLGGTLRRGETFDVGPNVPAKIVRVLVRPGMHVRKGATLATLDLGDVGAQVASARAGVRAAEAMLAKAVVGKAARKLELDAAVTRAEGDLAEARAKLRQAELATPLTKIEAASDAEKAAAGVRQAEAGVMQAEAGLRQAEDTLRRTELLYQHGGVAAVDLEGARTQAAIARAAYDTARAALDLAKSSERTAGGSVPEHRARIAEADLDAARSGLALAEEALRIARKSRDDAVRLAEHDITAAKAQLTQAKAGLKQAVASVGNAVLSSPADGVVTAVENHAGQFAQPGLPIVRIVSEGDWYVEVPVPAPIAASLRSGMRAHVRLLASAETTLPAQVSWIAPFTEGSGSSVPVRVRFASGVLATRPGEARAGAPVSVELLSPTPQCLLIPFSAVRYESGQATVFVVRNGRALLRRVVLGRTLEDRIEVVSGLSSNDRVLAAPPPSVRTGDRVRVMGR